MGHQNIPIQPITIDAPSEKTERVRQVTESVEDAVAYPLLTEQVSFPTSNGAPTSGYASGGPGQSLGTKAALAIGNVLGWKLNSGDPKGFIGSLTQAFTLNDIQGHTEATWNPRTYAVQTDLGGGITGAQASLYTRAQDAVQQSLQLLDGLYPLDPDADPEYVKALREMAKSQMNQILGELGAVGGPSVLRVNTYFQILLGQGNPLPTTNVEFNPDKVQGTLGTLRNTYGVYFSQNPFLNSIEDEQDITNFRVISDYMTSLLQSWVSNATFFLLGTDTPAFFGTQLVLISRQFSVIAETVNEVRFAMDSVFIGPSERQTLLLEFTDTTPAMFLEDILREIQDFVGTEGPRLLQDGGKISIPNNILPVTKNYRHLVHMAHTPGDIGNFNKLPDGYRTVRARRSLHDLEEQLKALIQLTKPVGQQVPPPTQEPEEGFSVLSVTPEILRLKNYNGPVSIIGTGFKSGIHASFPKAGNVGNTKFLSQNLIVARDVALQNPTTLLVENPDGTGIKFDLATSKSTPVRA
jgi:hypothetical protein